GRAQLSQPAVRSVRSVKRCDHTSCTTATPPPRSPRTGARLRIRDPSRRTRPTQPRISWRPLAVPQSMAVVAAVSRRARHSLWLRKVPSKQGSYGLVCHDEKQPRIGLTEHPAPLFAMPASYASPGHSVYRNRVHGVLDQPRGFEFQDVYPGARGGGLLILG